MARLAGVCIISAVVLSAVSGVRIDYQTITEDYEDEMHDGMELSGEVDDGDIDDETEASIPDDTVEGDNAIEGEVSQDVAAANEVVNEQDTADDTIEGDNVVEGEVSQDAAAANEVVNEQNTADDTVEGDNVIEGEASQDAATANEVVKEQNTAEGDNVIEGEVSQDATADTQDAPAKGLKITIEGFPDEIDGVHRGALNGVYYQDLKGNCVQGHPTYWQLPRDELMEGSLPFLYFCGKNTTRSPPRIHKKWAVSRKADLPKIQAGDCQTFAPFPAREDLKEGLTITHFHLGWKDGTDRGWSQEKDLISKVKISKVEPMDEAPSVDCAAQA